MNKEKKQTVEEIVKDIERSTGMPSYWKKIVLDLIYRLQDEKQKVVQDYYCEAQHCDVQKDIIEKQKAEIEKLKSELRKECEEHEAFTKKAKAEIERLTELQSRGSYRVAELGVENAELQKQVDELKAYAEDIYKKAIDREEDSYSLGFDKGKEQAVKDTAKEILDDLRNTFIEQSSYGCDANQHIGYYDYVVKIGLVIEQVEEYAKLKYGIEYGVEVE